MTQAGISRLGSNRLIGGVEGIVQPRAFTEQIKNECPRIGSLRGQVKTTRVGEGRSPPAQDVCEACTTHSRSMPLPLVQPSQVLHE
jgi:hypothetical protein